MKKLIVVAVIILVICSAVMLSSCQKLTLDETYDELQTALDNSLKEDKYYVKETRMEASGDTYISKINLHCETDDEGEAIRNADGTPKNWKLHILDTVVYNGNANATTLKELYCGEKNGACVLRVAEQGKAEINGTVPSVSDYLESEEYRPYSLSTLLAELNAVERNDLSVYEGKNAEKKGNIISVNLSLSADYYARYKAANGKDSVLKGDYITLEISYGRVQSIYVYHKSGDGLLSIDYESYKLEIAYLGPIFQI